MYILPLVLHLTGALAEGSEVNMKNIKRNPNRMKRVPRRTAINWVDAMTPQGQALYAAEFVDNASGRHLLYKYQSSRNLQWSLEQEGKSL